MLLLFGACSSSRSDEMLLDRSLLIDFVDGSVSLGMVVTSRSDVIDVERPSCVRDDGVVARFGAMPWVVCVTT